MSYCSEEFKTVEINDFRIKVEPACSGTKYTVTFNCRNILTDEEVGELIKQLTVPQKKTVRLKYR